MDWVGCVTFSSSPFFDLVFFPFFLELVWEDPEVEGTASVVRAYDQPTIASATMPTARRVSVEMVI